ncbi:hypothetical protein D3870_21155 [Noviherbaspirillum cavernae]|uniref:Uncharacterized protein n=1 Tax=Noviherbaspirillum cavernae TaxID=2320862 RepID=A0A418WW07_9BURK|nr:hypothetical protein [Noviherbaspirillum cavernae]RJF96886.1 hypothetical protein D3870_21155 [Noviherbaspirillum cavernae]
MSVSSVSRVGRNGYGADVGEIHTADGVDLPQPILRELLSPEQQALSLPQRDTTSIALAPLTRFLGPALTVANPVWTGDPVPRMRALQKILIEHALALPEAERPECLAAISVIDRNVQLRLRLQQMYMSDADMNTQSEKPEGAAA